jgi:hypothetical protein
MEGIGIGYRWDAGLMVRVTAIAMAVLILGACAHKPPDVPKPVPAAVELPPLPRPKPETHAHPNPPPVAQGPDIILVGASQAEIQSVLGEPSDRVEQGAGQSWTYRASHCKVDLTFFFDVSRNDFYALDRHIEGTDGSEKAAQRCLKQIREGHGPK